VQMLSIARFRGDPTELLQRKRERLDPELAPIARAHGRLCQVVVQVDEGLMLVNLWESDERRRGLATDPDRVRVFEASGMPPEEIESYEVAEVIR
jgi:hypothetical protein